MAHTKSAMKARRKSLKAYARNTILRKKIHDIRKKAEKAIAAKQKEAAGKLYLELQKVVDKASKTGRYLSRNTAARYKSNLAKKIRAIAK